MAKTKPGKWAWLKGKYPRLPEDPTYVEVLQAAQEPHRGKPMEQLAATINELEAKKDGIQRQLEDVNAELIAVERLLLESFDATGIPDIEITVGGYKFKSHVEPVVKIADVTEFDTWVRANCAHEMSVHHKRIERMLKEALEEGRAIPPGLTFDPRETVSRRAK